MTNIKTNKQIIDEEAGLMIRADKTLKELMEKKPSSRWGVKYWHPKYEKIMSQISKKYRLDELNKFVDFITYGQVGSRIYDQNGDVFYLQTKNMLNTGISYYEKFAKIKEGSYNDPKRSRLKEKDILIANAGIGSIGKVNIFLYKDKVNISQDIDILRISKINPFFIVIYIKSLYGNSQLWRKVRGVGAPKLPFEDIISILVPLLPDKIQNHIEQEHLKMSRFHDKAIESKKSGDEAGYKKNLEIAERMLRDLIKKTEQIIRGERNDVI